ncbi:MAG: pyridoxamine 5'-phosphate oxidase family protein [Nitrosopumilaceae archaeon]
MVSRDKFLKEQKILRLATIDPKGIPHIVPVWYLFSGKKFYVGTNTRTKKVKNVKKNNQVGFCVDVGIRAPNIYGVMGQGKASLILDKSKVNETAKKILLRYFSSLENPSAIELLENTNCVIEIVPQKFSVWNY